MTYMGYTTVSSIFASAVWNSLGNSIIKLLQNHSFVSGVTTGVVFGIILGSLAGSVIIDYIDTRRYERKEKLSDEEIAEQKRYQRKKRAKWVLSVGPFVSFLGLLFYILFKMFRYFNNLLDSSFGQPTSEIFWIASPILALILVWYTGK